MYIFVTSYALAEPKPFVEASLIIRKNDQSNGYHFKYVVLAYRLITIPFQVVAPSFHLVKFDVHVCSRYVHVLIQKMAVNVDLGFILSLVDFFSFSGTDPLFQVSVT